MVEKGWTNGKNAGFSAADGLFSSLDFYERCW
jgi:hypothetical protein